MENINCPAGLQSTKEIMNTPFETISEHCNRCVHFKTNGELSGCEYTLITGNSKITVFNSHENK